MIRLSGIERVFRVGEEEVHALRAVTCGSARASTSRSWAPRLGQVHAAQPASPARPAERRPLRTRRRDVTGLTDDEQARVRREKIGFVFQFFHLVPRLTAEQNIELPMVLAGIDPVERRRRLATLLAEYGLDRGRATAQTQLSGGQCQRVAIARAMSMRPAVILATNPPQPGPPHGQDVMTVLERVHQGGGTVILVTHDPEIGQRAKRCLRMRDGAIVSDETAGGAAGEPGFPVPGMRFADVLAFRVARGARLPFAHAADPACHGIGVAAVVAVSSLAKARACTWRTSSGRWD